MIEDGAKEGESLKGGLIGQTVLSRVADRIRARDRERSERVSLLALCFVLGFPIIIYFDHHGSAGRGYVAAIFVSVMVVVSWAQRAFRNHVWYWLLVAGLVLLHVAIWLVLPSHWDVSRRSIGLIGYSDFLGSWIIFFLFERGFGRGGRAVAN